MAKSRTRKSKIKKSIEEIRKQTGDVSILQLAVKDGDPISVELRNNHTLTGTLKAFDKHFNMVLCNVQETWKKGKVQPQMEAVKPEPSAVVAFTVSEEPKDSTGSRKKRVRIRKSKHQETDSGLITHTRFTKNLFLRGDGVICVYRTMSK